MSYTFFPSEAASGSTLVEVTADFTAAKNQFISARSTDGIHLRCTLPSSPAVGDVLTIQGRTDSLAPVALLSGSTVVGWVAPGSTRHLRFTSSGWAGDREIRNLIAINPGFWGHVESGGFEVTALNGAWAVAPNNLSNMVDADSATWTGVGGLDQVSGSTSHLIVASISPNGIDYRTNTVSYCYCRYRVTGTTGGGNLYNGFLGRYHGSNSILDTEFLGIPSSGSTIRNYQAFLSGAFERAGFSFEKESSGAFCNVEINTLVVLA